MNVKRTAGRDIGFLRKFIFMLCVVVVGFFVGSSSTMIYAYAIRGIDYPYDPDNYYSPTSISWADSAPSPFALSDLAGQGGSVFDYTRYIKSVAYYKNFSDWHELIKQKLGIDTDALQHSDESTKEKIAEQYANLASNISTSHSSNYDALPDYMTTDYIDVDGTKYKQQSNYLNDTFVSGVAAAQLNVNNSQDVYNALQEALERNYSATSEMQVKEVQQQIKDLDIMAKSIFANVYGEKMKIENAQHTFEDTERKQSINKTRNYTVRHFLNPYDEQDAKILEELEKHTNLRVYHSKGMPDF